MYYMIGALTNFNCIPHLLFNVQLYVSFVISLELNAFYVKNGFDSFWTAFSLLCVDNFYVFCVVFR